MGILTKLELEYDDDMAEKFLQFLENSAMNSNINNLSSKINDLNPPPTP